MSVQFHPLHIVEDLSPEEWGRIALENGEGECASNGAFNALTGKRTGRSTKDRYIVRDDLTKETVQWGAVNQPIEGALFNALWEEALSYLNERTAYVGHYSVAADPAFEMPLTVITEQAWHNLFAHNQFIRSSKKEESERAFTVLHAAHALCDPLKHGLHSEACIIIDFTQRKLLIRGTGYAGEIKKGIFSVLNFFLPEEDVLPMHCAANMGEKGETALFFGLSGTGKTTLSADPKRHLIGDDEHGWSKEGIFNFEGGCYAKCINLSKEKEPLIWEAIRSGAIMENVYLDPLTHVPDYTDDRYTENTRVAYPREFIQGCVPANRGGPPSSVIFLTCDLFGVLPPVSLLSPAQAAYHFLSGYTALIGSTEVGSTAGISTTFSTCFGAPFFPRPPQVYASLLLKRLEESQAQVYLVNTGWSGGPYGEGGQRFSIPTTRAIIDGIFSGALLNAKTEIVSPFRLKVPFCLSGVETRLLNPRNAWKDPQAFDRISVELAEAFKKNFKKYQGIASHIVLEGGPV